MAQPEIVANELQLIITRYLQQTKQAANAARDVDKALKDLITTADKASKALNGLSSAKIDLKVNTSQLDRVVTDVRAIDGLDPEIVIVVDDGELATAQTDIRTLSEDVGVKIDVQADASKAKNEIDALDNEPLKPDVDANIAPARTEINKLDGQTVEVKVDGDVSGLRSALDNVITGAQERIGARATDAAASLDPFAGIADSAAAVRTFGARAGEEIENVGTIIDNVFIQGLAESRVEVANVAAQLSNLGVNAQDLEAATLSAFQASAATGEDVSEIIRAQSAIVKNDLAPSYSAAADILVTGFQSGANRAGDLIDTFDEYSSVFNTLGIDGGGALSLINQALDQGAFNSDKLGDSFKELNLILTAAIDTGEGDAADALRRLGLFDEAQATLAGEITGAQFADAVVAAVREKGTNTDLVSIFGTPVEDLGFDIFKGLDFGAALTSTVESGTAQQAADELNNTLTASLTELGRTIQQEIGENFKIAGMSLNDFLDQAKVKVQEIATLIQDGKTIPEALEIALEAPGLAEKIDEFSAGVSNFIIELQLAIAGFLEAVGQGGAAAGIRAGVVSQATTQLQFDLRNADNASEVLALVETATRRGVAEDNAVAAINASLQELVDSGNISKVEELLDVLREVNTTSRLPVTVSGPFGIGAQTQFFEVPEDLVGKTGDEIAAILSERLGSALPLGVSIGEAFTESIDVSQIQTQVEGIRQQINAAFEAGDIAGGFNLVDQFFPDQRGAYEDIALDRLNRNFLDPLKERLGALAVTSNLQGEQSLAFTGLVPSTDEEGRVRYFIDTILVDFQGELTQTKADAEATFEALRTEVNGTVPDASTQLGDFTTATEEAGAALSILGEAGPQAVTAFVDQFIIDIDRAILKANELAGAMQGVGGSLPTVGGVGGSGTPERGFFTGGVADGLFMAGEAGRELISTNTALAVLNNRTTETLLSGIAAALSGGMGSTSKSITINNVFNTQSLAEANGVGGALANRVRGF